MGENGTLSQAGELMMNGLLPNKTSHVTKALDAERWSKVEERGAELIACIQPNQQSEERRNAVTNYVQTLIKKCFSCEVFTFGVLENEKRQIKNIEFRVKEVKYIDAKVGHLISQSELFKRSIILIKAWGYYESMILGAHFRLISTYTLKILVLYIFHVFNNSFVGPFEVLYHFLEVFCNFDWKHFCVSIWGPSPINSLLDTTAELPQKSGGKLLCDKVFLETFRTTYVVSLSGQKSQANFYRIRSTFAFGAKNLAELLDCPKENLIPKVNRFFLNTWERHQSGN